MNFDLNKSVQVLERTPLVINMMLAGIDNNWVVCDEGQETWSPYDIVGHLIHGELTDWIPRLKIILDDNESTFEPFDRFAQFENSKGKEMLALIAEFRILRARNIEFLKRLKLSPQDFEKKAFHPELGEVSLSQLLAAWVVHDLGHIVQISRVMAKRYKNDVGPWTEYMTVLNDK